MRLAVLQHHMFIHQHPDAQALQFMNPGVGARVVLVVAGDKVGAVGGRQPGQRRHMVGQFGHRAVNQVAGHRHHVHLQGVDRAHDGLQVAMFDGGADMDVADLCD